MCASCLVSALQSARDRGMNMGMGPGEGPLCPVCRAVLKGWDWKGGGVIGLEVKVQGKDAGPSSTVGV